MLSFTKFKQRFSAKKAATTLAVVLTLAGASAFGWSALTSGSAEASCAGDPSANAIIKCGEPNRAAFITAVKKSTELQRIYAHFGLTAADYNRFVTSARPGYAVRANNTIVVDGRVVANSAWSIGRLKSYQGSNPMTVNIAGAGTYYGNYNSQAFSPNHSQIPVDVLFNSKGQMQFAVMTGTCANPGSGQVVTPYYQCKSLNAKQVDTNTWSFNTSVNYGNGAKVCKLTYNFGDGSAPVSTTNPAQSVTHVFTKAARTTVTVTYCLPGGATVNVYCVHDIPYTPPKPPILTCNNLTMTPGDINSETGAQAYTLTGHATAQNATISTYSFAFGDGQSAAVNTSATTATTNHTYAPGDYTAVLTVSGKDAKGNSITAPATDACRASIHVAQPQPSKLACVNLTSVAGSINPTTGAQDFTLTGKARANNATISTYSFAFGDGQSAAVNTSATTATTSHTYAPGDYTAVLTVSGKDAKGNPITAPANEACKVTIHVNTPGTPGITILKLVDGQPQEQVQVGQTFTYTVKVTNSGQADLTNVAVTDPAPAGVTMLTTDKGTIEGNVLHYTIPSLPVGASDTITITAVVKTYMEGNLNNTACVVSEQTPTKNCSTATVTVPPVCAYNPELPADSPECKPPVPTPPVTPPTTLVNTGAGSVMGVFAAATAVGALGYRFFLARKFNQ